MSKFGKLSNLRIGHVSLFLVDLMSKHFDTVSKNHMFAFSLTFQAQDLSQSKGSGCPSESMLSTFHVSDIYLNFNFSPPQSIVSTFLFRDIYLIFDF